MPALTPPSRAQRFRAALPALLLGCVLAVALIPRFRNIAESLPYCRHVDEKTWIQIAWRMLREGDPNPRRFTKPSLPAYTLVGGSALGLARAKWNGDAESARDLGSRAYPFYRVPSAVEVPKWFFAGFSVGALFLLGWVARELSRREALYFVAPALALISSSYFLFSWSYLVVDILGAFFVWATTAYVYAWYQRTLQEGYGGRRALRDVLIAGVLAGATVGCKYNLFPIALPCGLVLLYQGKRSFLPLGLAFSAAILGTFFLTTPYAIFDHSTFMADVLREMRHYSTGHRGQDNAGALDSFFAYARVLYDNWGLLLPLAAFGIFELARTRFREFTLLYAFPIVFFLYMAKQRVVFERNIVSLHLFVALGLALGALRLVELLAPLLRKLGPTNAAPRTALATLAISALVLAAVPWGAVADAYRSDIESRNSAERWLLEHLPPTTPVTVDARLQMDTRRLAKLRSVSTIGKSAARGQTLSQLAPGTVALLPLAKGDGFGARPGKILARFGRSELHKSGNALDGDPKLAIVQF
jgi:hypothetical protein